MRPVPLPSNVPSVFGAYCGFTLFQASAWLSQDGQKLAIVAANAISASTYEFNLSLNTTKFGLANPPFRLYQVLGPDNRQLLESFNSTFINTTITFEPLSTVLFELF